VPRLKACINVVGLEAHDCQVRIIDFTLEELQSAGRNDLELPNARRWIDLLDFSQQTAIPFDRIVQIGNWQADVKVLTFVTLIRFCGFLPSSPGTWFRLENYGRSFRSWHLGQFPMLHRMNIARHRRGDLCIRDGLASTTRRDR
jgi:hypothetical protein